MKYVKGISLFLSVFIILGLAADYLIVGKFLMPENRLVRFFAGTEKRVDGRGFALFRPKFSLDKMPIYENLVNGQINGKEDCRLLYFGPDRLQTREWCSKASSIENRATTQPTSDYDDVYIVLGGSYAYGDGLNDHETIASRLAENGGYALNFARSAGGLHHFLYSLYNDRRLQRSFDRPVTLVYPFMWDHLVRQNFGATDCCFSWGPRFEFDQKTDLYFVDDFSNVYLNDYLDFVKYAFNSSWLVIKTFELDYRYDELHFYKHCRIAEEINKRAIELYGNDTRFIIVNMTDHQDEPSLVKCYENLGVSYMRIFDKLNDYSEKDKLAKYFFENDGHPTPELASLVAKMILGVKP